MKIAKEQTKEKESEISRMNAERKEEQKLVPKEKSKLINEMNKLNKLLKDKESEISKLNIDKKKNTEELKKHKKLIKDKEAEITKLNETIKRGSSSTTADPKKAKSQEKDKNKFKGKSKDKDKSKDAEDAKELTVELTNIKKQLKDKEAEITRINNERKEEKKLIPKSKAQIISELNKVKKTLSEKESEIAKLSADKDDIEGRLNEEIEKNRRLIDDKELNSSISERYEDDKYSEGRRASEVKSESELHEELCIPIKTEGKERKKISKDKQRIAQE